MDVFNHHFTVVFWLITSSSTSVRVYSLWSTRPTAWNSTHCLVCAAKLISFTRRPNKSFPRPKQNANSNPAAVLYVTVETLVPEERGGEFWNRDTRSELTFDTERSELGSRSQQWSVHCDGGASDFSGQCPLSKEYKVSPVGTELSDCLIKAGGKSIISASLISSQHDSFPTWMIY